MRGRNSKGGAWSPNRLFEFGIGERHRLLPMEGLRGIAVFLVFLVHYGTLFGPWAGTDGATGRFAEVSGIAGHAGVDLFFVLSGYLIYGAVIRRPVAYGAFLRRRVQRIYPAFLAVFAIYLVLSFLAPAQSKIPDGLGAVPYLIANLLLLPGLFPIEPMITVAWSLSYEFAYYLVLPLLVMALRMRDWDPRRRIAFVVGLGALTLVAAAVVAAVPARMVVFVAGIVLYELRAMAGSSEPTLPRSREAVLILGSVGLSGLGIWLGHTTSLTPELGGALRVACLCLGFGALTLVAFRPGTATGRALSWAPLRWLGNMSYSFYLIHGLALNLFAQVAKRLLPPNGDMLLVYWALMPVGFAIAFVVSAVLFLAVERPFSLEGRGLLAFMRGRNEKPRDADSAHTEASHTEASHPQVSRPVAATSGIGQSTEA